MTDRQALFDVGIAGPLAGLCVALPAIVVGLHWSELILTGAEEHAGIALGTPLLFSLLQWLTLDRYRREAMCCCTRSRLPAGSACL